MQQIAKSIDQSMGTVQGSGRDVRSWFSMLFTKDAKEITCKEQGVHINVTNSYFNITIKLLSRSSNSSRIRFNTHHASTHIKGITYVTATESKTNYNPGCSYFFGNRDSALAKCFRSIDI